MRNFIHFKPFYSVFIVVIAISSLKGVRGTTFKFINKCDYTVWPGILSGSTSAALSATGFELSPSGTQAFPAPAGWSGRFWARTGCNFTAPSGQGSCTTGDCGSGRVECAGAGAAPPATLAEFTLNGSGGQDFYDVSLVDGYNLPMIIEASGGSGSCGSTGCLVDLNRRCPPELQVDGGNACKSACEAFGNPEYCCNGAYSSPATCQPSTYSQMFKSACPKSYSYAYDDATSTFTCTGADYTITFCPSKPSQKSSMGSSTGGPESQPASGTVLADGSWLASLATGDSTLTHPSFHLEFVFILLSIRSLIFSLFDRL